MRTTKKTVSAVLLSLLALWCVVRAADINGTAGNDMLTGTNGIDNIDGMAGNDTIDGRGENDKIKGGAGNDTIDGGPGADEISGDDGDDQITGDQGNDDLSGGAGQDRIDGGVGNDTIKGGADADTIDGGEGDDDIRGGYGNDTIDGGNGNDDIIAGEGVDTYMVKDNNGNDRTIIRAGDVPPGMTEKISCGSGDDTVVFRGISRKDWIPGTRQVRDPDSGGIYEIDPNCENLGRSVDEFAFLAPKLTPSTTCAAEGTAVALTGENFPPLAAITVSLGEVKAAEFQTDEAGAFSASFNVPGVAPGTYPLRLTSAESGFEQHAFFTVVGDAGPAGGGRSMLYLAAAVLLAGILVAYALLKRSKARAA
jgi:RTX calcium-binding nonapeptide repeat (4 copies)